MKLSLIEPIKLNDAFTSTKKTRPKFSGNNFSSISSTISTTKLSNQRIGLSGKSSKDLKETNGNFHKKKLNILSPEIALKYCESQRLLSGIKNEKIPLPPLYQNQKLSLISSPRNSNGNIMKSRNKNQTVNVTNWFNSRATTTRLIKRNQSEAYIETLLQKQKKINRETENNKNEENKNQNQNSKDYSSYLGNYITSKNQLFTKKKELNTKTVSNHNNSEEKNKVTKSIRILNENELMKCPENAYIENKNHSRCSTDNNGSYCNPLFFNKTDKDKSNKILSNPIIKYNFFGKMLQAITREVEFANLKNEEIYIKKVMNILKDGLIELISTEEFKEVSLENNKKNTLNDINNNKLNIVQNQNKVIPKKYYNNNINLNNNKNKALTKTKSVTQIFSPRNLKNNIQTKNPLSPNPTNPYLQNDFTTKGYEIDPIKLFCLKPHYNYNEVLSYRKLLEEILRAFEDNNNKDLTTRLRYKYLNICSSKIPKNKQDIVSKFFITNIKGGKEYMPECDERYKEALFRILIKAEQRLGAEIVPLNIKNKIREIDLAKRKEELILIRYRLRRIRRKNKLLEKGIDFYLNHYSFKSYDFGPGKLNLSFDHDHIFLNRTFDIYESFLPKRHFGDDDIINKIGNSQLRGLLSSLYKKQNVRTKGKFFSIEDLKGGKDYSFSSDAMNMKKKKKIFKYKKKEKKKIESKKKSKSINKDLLDIEETSLEEYAKKKKKLNKSMSKSKNTSRRVNTKSQYQITENKIKSEIENENDGNKKEDQKVKPENPPNEHPLKPRRKNVFFKVTDLKQDNENKNNVSLNQKEQQGNNLQDLNDVKRKKSSKNLSRNLSRKSSRKNFAVDDSSKNTSNNNTSSIIGGKKSPPKITKPTSTHNNKDDENFNLEIMKNLLDRVGTTKKKSLIHINDDNKQKSGSDREHYGLSPSKKINLTWNKQKKYELPEDKQKELDEGMSRLLKQQLFKFRRTGRSEYQELMKEKKLDKFREQIEMLKNWNLDEYIEELKRPFSSEEFLNKIAEEKKIKDFIINMKHDLVVADEDKEIKNYRVRVVDGMFKFMYYKDIVDDDVESTDLIPNLEMYNI